MAQSDAQLYSPLGEGWSVPVRYLVAFLPTLVISTLFFFDALFMDKSIVHGDSIAHGLAVIDYHAKVLAGQESVLWSEKLFGGHPVFAESQFAFLSPLNNLVAGLMAPVTAHNVFHWGCLLLSGMGMVALCFRLNLSLVATMFATTAVASSGMWLDQQQNMTISGTLAWIPWALWALERWLVNPRAFIALAMTIVLMVFAGYPQLLHATLTFMFVSLVGIFVSREECGRVFSAWRLYLLYGLAAVLLAVGLAAIQLLPLLELISLSHRSAGIELIRLPAEMMFKGLIFASAMEGMRSVYFWLMSSTVVCVLASLIVLLRPRPRIAGYIAATFLLLNLGFGQASPLFSLVYEFHLLPGLHSFRMSWPFFAPAIVGLAIISATVLDGLPGIRYASWRVIAVLIALATGWVLIFMRLHDAQIPVTHYVLLSFLLALGAVLVLTGRGRWLGFAVFAALLAETSLLKLELMRFHTRAVFEAPPTVGFLREHGDLENYRVHDVTEFGAYIFVPPRFERMQKLVENMLDAVTPSTNLLWDITAFGGAHALPLSGRILLEPVVQEEIMGDSAGRAGLRFVDILGMRYITAASVLTGSGFDLLYRSTETPVKLHENQAALPRFQSYQSWEFVDSEEEALAKAQAANTLRLWVQRPAGPVLGAAPSTEVHTAQQGAEELAITLLAERSTDYTFAIDAPAAGWFFMADANFPGWNAAIDGQPATVYSAQILGKAMWIPRGSHRLHVWFDSRSFNQGAIISFVTFILLLLGLLAKRLRRPGHSEVQRLEGA